MLTPGPKRIILIRAGRYDYAEVFLGRSTHLVGQNNAGKVPPLTAAEAAQSLGIKVYTIGVGTRGEAPFPQFDAFGRKNFGKRKTFTTKKRVHNILKTATVTARGIWYESSHEKTLLGFSPASEPRRASFQYQGRPISERSPWLS